MDVSCTECRLCAAAAPVKPSTTNLHNHHLRLTAVLLSGPTWMLLAANRCIATACSAPAGCHNVGRVAHTVQCWTAAERPLIPLLLRRQGGEQHGHTHTHTHTLHQSKQPLIHNSFNLFPTQTFVFFGPKGAYIFQDISFKKHFWLQNVHVSTLHEAAAEGGSE